MTRLYVRRARGESVDGAEVAQAGREAVRAVIPKQIAAGIDVGNNGEQQRESFFLYLKERVTGFGGSWERPSRADVDRYPGFKKRWLEQTSSKERVSPNEALPMAIGEVAYKDDGAIEAECRDLQEILTEFPDAFVDRLMDAPSPGIVAAAVRNAHYDTERRYLEALGEALRIEYEAIVRSGFVLQIDAPDLALERHVSYKDQPLSSFLAFVENVTAVINGALRNIPRDRVRIHVCWGNSKSPHDSDVPLEDILRSCGRRRSAASCCLSLIPATRTSSAPLRRCPSTTTRSSSPA